MFDKYKLNIKDLKPNNLLEKMDFNTTKEIIPKIDIIGQDRAVNSIEFGIKIDKKGYNIYVSGISGTQKYDYTYDLIRKHSHKKQLKDFLYVNNFKNENEPISLCLEAGMGKVFKKDIDEMIDKIKDEIPKIFLSKEYEYHKKILSDELENDIQCILEELNNFANKRNFHFDITEKGLISVPIKDDKTIMTEEEIGLLTTDEIHKLKETNVSLTKESKNYIDRIKKSEELYKIKNEELDKNVGKSLIRFYKNNLLEKYNHDEKICRYINDLSEDIIKNISKFKKDEYEKNTVNILGIYTKNTDKFFDRYKVNLFIDNSQSEDVLILSEDNPTYYNLNGCVEYTNEMGTLTTSFMQIKPGILHKANGGYLILNIRDLLSNPFSWDLLKRSLKTNKIKIEPILKHHTSVVTSILKPEPIEIDLKVILLGDFYLYNFIYNYDEDFRSLFKILADFDCEIDKNFENIKKLVDFISYKCNSENLKHFDNGAINRIIEYAIRLSDNKNKITARFDKIMEIIYETQVVSNEKYIKEDDVLKVIDMKKYRHSKYEQKLNEMFDDNTLLIDIEGEKIGQINGLAVIGNGEYSFGKPSKITACTYKGKEGIINIEREIKQSGNIHDKGVLILSGYLGSRYGKEKPLSITTSITFEQNYSVIDGDSASSTELYAIISSIANLPIKQYIAVTGSVSQKGEIQPIGGINEKIEGFFDICKMKGLNKKQGVLMPIQNVKNLVLKDEVVEAVKNGEFNIYAISNIEEGLEILTGKSIEEIDNLVNKNLEVYRKVDNKE